MSRIEPLLRNFLQHHIPHAVVYGRLLNGLGTVGSFWNVDRSVANWRPEGQIHYVLGRILPDMPPPSLDEESVRSGVNNKTALETNQHRFSLMAPQQIQAPDGWYAHQVEIADQAAQVFAQASTNQVSVRLLTIPSSFPASGARGNSIYTVQHFPLVMETMDGEVLWEHPEAERMSLGHRIGSTGQGQPRPVMPSPTPAPAATPATAPAKAQATRPAPKAPVFVATPQSASWYDQLRREVEEDCVPPENVQEVIRRRRIRYHRDSGLTDQAAETKTDEEIKALQAPAAPTVTWYQVLLQEAQEDGVPEAKLQEVIRRRRIRFHRDSGLADQAAEAKTDEEIKALQAPAAPTAPTSAWYQELLQEVREDGIPEDKVKEAIRRRRIRFHREGGLTDQAAETKTDEEIKALQTPAVASVPARVSTPAAKKAKATPVPATATDGEVPTRPVKRTPRTKVKGGGDSESKGTGSSHEKESASPLITAILETGAVRDKDLAENCGVSSTYLYMLKTERDGRKGEGLIPHLRLVKEAIDQGLPLPPALERKKSHKGEPKAPKEKGTQGPEHQEL